MESIFAGKAILGGRYITVGGWPVTVLEVGNKVLVRNDLTGNESRLFVDQLLRPYQEKFISKEAVAMAKMAKEVKNNSGSKGVRGGERGARKTSEGILIFRKIGAVMHEALCADGVLVYRSKKYASLKELASAIRGKEVSGSGRSFFGLRVEPYVNLRKEIIKQLSDVAKKAEPKKEAKPKKAVKKVAYDEDDEQPKTAGEVVAKIFGRGRS